MVSRPVWARGLKLMKTNRKKFTTKSRPVWARGLKLKRGLCNITRVVSRPVWARGLKLIENENKEKQGKVASRVGAWIETFSPNFNILENKLCPAWVETADQHD